MSHSFKTAIQQEKPLQIVGAINALTAKLAANAGFKALYLSGAGIANAEFALPDLAVTNLTDVVNTVSKITFTTDLPLLVDVDTGWGNCLTIQRAFKALDKAGASGAHIEDQADYKRCGHRGGKILVSTSQMQDRIRAAVDGRVNNDFMVMARTDAIANEGIDKAVERAVAYAQAGCDAIFVEAATTLQQYQQFSAALKIPILANITEFGQTPLFNVQALGQSGVAMILYPLSAFRAMNAAALKVYSAIRKEGTQESVLPIMQTRKELYQLLNYEQLEKELDTYFDKMEQE